MEFEAWTMCGVGIGEVVGGFMVGVVSWVGGLGWGFKWEFFLS